VSARADERDTSSVFRIDPHKGAFVSSFGPKGFGKSEFITRYTIGYPFNALVMDITEDVDPQHTFTRPFTQELHELARELDDIKEQSTGTLEEFAPRVRAAWSPEGRPVKYRLVPQFHQKGWLEKSDLYIGLAYLVGRCFIHLDEIDDEAPANQTPRFTELALRLGRHRELSMGMAGPRPADISPLVLNQSDIVTIHGPLHELDIKRMAMQLHLSTSELSTLISELEVSYRDDVKVSSYLAFIKDTRELLIMPPLPPRAA
jgi:DNA helicase HerA-like ATPase